MEVSELGKGQEKGGIEKPRAKDYHHYGRAGRKN